MGAQHDVRSGGIRQITDFLLGLPTLNDVDLGEKLAAVAQLSPGERVGRRLLLQEYELKCTKAPNRPRSATTSQRILHSV